nr:uncharacterized protein LOC109764043 isoform X2 [Aegilops tauschii subsp. strangulata]XP_045086941.1 uncharacterized protein LOC109764043 isoform X2 [Aegilops tauschii subsp. strangulata]XP_045086942.1 uncharacterized protein LOC109764043 isoform X2 [Aegilops tauschii subsp. strangulata]
MASYFLITNDFKLKMLNHAMQELLFWAPMEDSCNCCQEHCQFSGCHHASNWPLICLLFVLLKCFFPPSKLHYFQVASYAKQGIWIRSRNGAREDMSNTCLTLDSGFFLQVDHTIVRISARIILYIMLDHLGICRVIYRLRMYSQNTISVVVLFYTSVQSNGICILYCTATL